MGREKPGRGTRAEIIMKRRDETDRTEGRRSRRPALERYDRGLADTTHEGGHRTCGEGAGYGLRSRQYGAGQRRAAPRRSTPVSSTTPQHLGSTNRLGELVPTSSSQQHADQTIANTDNNRDAHKNSQGRGNITDPHQRNNEGALPPAQAG